MAFRAATVGASTVRERTVRSLPLAALRQGIMKNKYYFITLLILAADFISKWVVEAKLFLEERNEIIPGFLRLCLTHNTGVAFGIFNDVQSVWKPYVLAGMAIIAIIIIVIYAIRMPKNRKLLQLALAITLGGILGNFVDRIFHGFVVDYIDFYIKDFDWPTFNIADSAITIGIVLLLIDTIRSPASEQTEPTAAGSGQVDPNHEIHSE